MVKPLSVGIDEVSRLVRDEYLHVVHLQMGGMRFLFYSFVRDSIDLFDTTLYRQIVMDVRNKLITKRLCQNNITLNIRLTETQGLRLPDEPQEGRNRSWTAEEFSVTL
ncbi:hypothetical protein CSKR_108783 [Clonorchis sinensis]|uniref:Uncharacterized protein n=1 Tax=Clonorchis sinensis TaxID=79923 RepID=A0A419Q574_CLOSI|nr:hypothetical protein CSKR_108783 [Clonorchis sinensis]